MPYPAPTSPVIGPDSFLLDTPVAALSRSAILLHLAAQLRGDAPALATDSEGVFPIPSLEASGERFRWVSEPGILRDSAERNRAALARELFDRPSLAVAEALAWTCLVDPDPLTRVAAAALEFWLVTDPRESLDVLAHGTADDDELVRNVAAAALARISPGHPSLAQLYESGTSPSPGQSSHTSLLVHGTFARTNTWWMPGGEFHQYLLTLRPDLYSAPDRFDWSGRYSEAARSEAATQLADWVVGRALSGLSLFTHSHGGNVAMIASHDRRFAIRDLVLLSCPVHAEYTPAFDNVDTAVSIRVKLDLVILADGGGQKFHDSRIEEHVLPVWFNHSATHSAQTWRRHHVDGMIPTA